MHLLKKLVIAILTFEARVVLWRFKPKIIAVVGSVGKTSAKDAIYTALKDSHYIRKNQKSMNSEVGAPLTILALDTAWNNPLLWLKNIIIGAFRVCARRYPEWLVLEVGADRPGDISSIARWLKPHMVVVTSLPDVPVHVEFFESPEALIQEDLSIITYMDPSGTLIINADETRSHDVVANAKVPVLTYGSSLHAAVHFQDVSVVYEEYDGITKPIGTSCTVSYEGSSVPLSVHGVLGITHMYPLVAAVAVGVACKQSFISVTTALATHEPPRGRMCLVDGKNGSTIIDDSYNASPVAVEKALDALIGLKTVGNKIAVLGDMLEIGSFTAAAHKQVGVQIAQGNLTYFVAIGVRMQYAAEAAIAAGMSPDKVVHVRTSEEAAAVTERLVKQNDIVLVKGSQGTRAERVVARIMAHPEDRKALLVRQEDVWMHR